MAVDLKEIFAVRTAYNEDINPAIDRGATEKLFVVTDLLVGLYLTQVSHITI